MPPSSAQELAVLRSVIYASLFDYPLTLAQLRNSLAGVAADEPTIASWWKGSALLQSTVECRGGLYFPAGRADLLETRARRETLSRDLLERDRAMLAFVARLPFIRMVALSGSLAHLNAEGAADVDLFVITRANRVWLVTVAMLLVSKILGWRKRLCMNYVISERQMAIAPADLFSANQIIHLRPVAGWPMYQRFLDANPFVARCYPNFRADVSSSTPDSRPALSKVEGLPTSDLAEAVLSLGLAQLGERVSRAVYRWHLRRQSARWQSRDQVRLEDECLKLHTSSHRAETRAKFEAAIENVLTKVTKNTKNTKADSGRTATGPNASDASARRNSPAHWAHTCAPAVRAPKPSESP